MRDEHPLQRFAQLTRKASGSRPRGKVRAAVGLAVLAPDVGEDAELRRLELVHVEAARLAAAVRPWLAEPRRDRDDDGVLAARRGQLELAPLRDRALVDVPGEDQVGARFDQGGEHVVPSRDRLLPRPPRRAEQMVVQSDDPVGAVRRAPELLGGAAHLLVAKPPGLVAPRPDRGLRPTTTSRPPVDRLGRRPEPLELTPRAGDRRGKCRGCRGCRGSRRAEAEAAQEAAACSCWSRRPRCVRSPLAITSSGSSRPPGGRAPRSTRAGRLARSGGLRDGGDVWAQPFEAIQSSACPRPTHRRSSTTSTSASAPAARCGSSGAASR